MSLERKLKGFELREFESIQDFLGSDRVIKIKKDNSLIAIIRYSINKKEKDSWIGYIETIKNQRGKGYGTQLMKKYLEKMKKQGIQIIQGRIDEGNPYREAALKLCKKFDFEIDQPGIG